MKDFLSDASIDSGKVRIGVVIYSTYTEVQFHLNRYKSKHDILDAIDNIRYMIGSTHTYGGLYTARTQMFTAENGDRAGVPNVIFLITDGVSNINALQTIPEAEAIRAENIHIYAIGIGLTNTSELNQIASFPPTANSFTVDDFNELQGLKHKIFESYCPGTYFSRNITPVIVLVAVVVVSFEWSEDLEIVVFSVVNVCCFASPLYP
uniref:VWFA domain-containing protein n=1 Tax=Octopus bimaculoides TaxID=37653 RepID=A0A0L8FYL2_OCTBM